MGYLFLASGIGKGRELGYIKGFRSLKGAQKGCITDAFYGYEKAEKTVRE